MANSISDYLTDKEVLTDESIAKAKELFSAFNPSFESEEIMHVTLLRVNSEKRTKGVSSFELYVITLTRGGHELELPLSTYFLEGDGERFKDAINGVIGYVHKREILGE